MTDERLKVQIGTNISNLRKRQGLTQAGLAEKVNYSDKAVSKWERGESVPDILTLVALAEVLGVKLIDQQKNGYITKANAYLYGQDEGTGIYALHPNVMGHELTMRLIVEEMYKHLS